MSTQHKITTSWEGNLSFEANIDGHTVRMDAPEASGGNNSAASPKKLMLAALSGCTGMDVISILHKMQVKPDSLHIEVQGDLTPDHPKQYFKIHVIYHFKGKDLPLPKLEKAVKMSEDTYCGVRATYAQSMTLTSEIRISEK